MCQQEVEERGAGSQQIPEPGPQLGCRGSGNHSGGASWQDQQEPGWKTRTGDEARMEAGRTYRAGQRWKLGGNDTAEPEADVRAEPGHEVGREGELCCGWVRGRVRSQSQASKEDRA